MGSNHSSQQRKEGAGKVPVPARGPTALECVSLCPASCVPSLLATLAQASPALCIFFLTSSTWNTVRSGDMLIQELGAVHSLQRGDQGPTLPHPWPPTQIQHAGCSGRGRGQPQNSRHLMASARVGPVCS